MREKIDAKKKNATEYTSHQKLKADRFKHSRGKGEVQEKYKAPLTSNQSNGYFVNDPNQKEIAKPAVNKPIYMCSETKYANEMVKTGHLFA